MASEAEKTDPEMTTVHPTPTTGAAEEAKKPDVEDPHKHETRSSIFSARQGKTLSWQDLSYSVGSGEKEVQILKNNFGAIPAVRDQGYSRDFGADSSGLSFASSSVAPSSAAPVAFSPVLPHSIASN
eukprot:scaffold2850_cov235-Pinguiococcus_pyrenoidosus.AAC.9